MRIISHNDDNELWIQQNAPRQVALVIIVREQRIRAQPQELGEIGFVGQVGSLAQQLRGGLEKVAVRHPVRDPDELVAALPDDVRLLIYLVVLLGMLLHVLLDLVAREAFRKKPAPGSED